MLKCYLASWPDTCNFTTTACMSYPPPFHHGSLACLPSLLSPDVAMTSRQGRAKERVLDLTCPTSLCLTGSANVNSDVQPSMPASEIMAQGALACTTLPPCHHPDTTLTCHPHTGSARRLASSYPPIFQSHTHKLCLAACLGAQVDIELLNTLLNQDDCPSPGIFHPSRSNILAVSPALPNAMRRVKWSLDDYVLLKQLHKGYASDVFHVSKGVEGDGGPMDHMHMGCLHQTGRCCHMLVMPGSWSTCRTEAWDYSFLER